MDNQEKISEIMEAAYRVAKRQFDYDIDVRHYEQSVASQKVEFITNLAYCILRELGYKDEEIKRVANKKLQKVATYGKQNQN